MKYLFLFFLLLFLRLEVLAQDSLFKFSVQEIMNLPVSVPSFFEQEVSSASMMAQQSSEAPANLLVITQEQIIERGYQDLSDVLKDLPGMDISENAGYYGEYYTIRGINGNDRFLILVNGRKINSPSGTHLSVGNSFSVRFLDRIEIVYGSSSLIYGSDAFSGVINLISKKTVINNEVKHNIQSNYGNFNSLDAFLETQLNLKNSFSLHSFARIYHSDGFAPPLKGIYEFVKSYPASIPTEFSQPINDHTIFLEAKYKNFKAGYFRQGYDEGFAHSALPSSFLVRPESKWKLNQNIYWFSYEKKFEKAGILSADVSHIRYIQDNSSQNIRFSVINNPQSTIINQYYAGEDISWKTLITYSQDIKKINFIIGLQNEYIESIPHYANTELFNRPLKFEGGYADTIRQKLTIKESKLGIFGQMGYNIHPKISLIGGLRYDYSQLFGANFIPRVSLIMKPFSKTIFKFIYGSAFQNPSLWFKYEQFSTSINRMVSAASVYGFGLKSQRVESYELDFIQHINKNWIFEANIFYNVAIDLIGRSTFTQSVENPFAGKNTIGIRNENLGKQKAYGFTLKTDYRAEKWNAYLYYTFTNAQIAQTDASLVALHRVSPHKIWAGVQVKDIFKYFSLSSRVRWVNYIQGMQNSPAYQAPDFRANGFFYWNANLNIMKLIPKTRIFLTTENILNDTEIVNVGTFYGSVLTDTAIPQAGLIWKIGLEANF